MRRAACALALTLAAAAALFAPAAVSRAIDLRDIPTVVVDAGHGGEDGGVTGRLTGVKESDLNLAVALVLGEYLESAGMRVVYTRVNADALTSGEFDKRRDMHLQADIIARAAPDAVVSIHMNTFPDPSRRGAQVFYDAGNEEGARLAAAVQEMLNDDFNLPDAGRGFSALAADKFLLRESAAPAVIVECGFLSNGEDEAALTDPRYRARLAYTVFRAITAYLSSRGA